LWTSLAITLTIRTVPRPDRSLFVPRMPKIIDSRRPPKWTAARPRGAAIIGFVFFRRLSRSSSFHHCHSCLQVWKERASERGDDGETAPSPHGIKVFTIFIVSGRSGTIILPFLTWECLYFGFIGGASARRAPKSENSLEPGGKPRPPPWAGAVSMFRFFRRYVNPDDIGTRFIIETSRIIKSGDT
jgi:hypothetical protein